MSDSWVGFRPSPKRDLSRPTASLQFELSSKMLIPKVLKLLTTKEGIESWLIEFTKFDARLGAKLKFSFGEENYGGTFARIDIPKRIILLTELHGELDFSFTEKPDGTDLKLTISKTINDSERSDWEKIANEAWSSLKKVMLNA